MTSIALAVTSTINILRVGVPKRRKRVGGVSVTAGPAQFAGSTQYYFRPPISTFTWAISHPTLGGKSKSNYIKMSFGGNGFGQQQQPNPSFITAHRNQVQGAGGGITHPQQQQHVVQGNLLPHQPGQLAVPPPVPQQQQQSQQSLQTSFPQVSQEEVSETTQKAIVPYGAGSEDDGVRTP
ncbi:hypothetical protein FRB93_006583 [Tulasnella sp. JGI-2019a]|nr:hypothetical protein FRB93_006583 [Tulasnella sp. JGI-2019a]